MSGRQPGQETGPTPPDEAGVVGWLRDNPDFLLKNPDLFLSLTPVSLQSGDGVADLQQRLIARLREQVREAEKITDILVLHARDNLHSQNRVHHCVLRLLEAEKLHQLLDAATKELAAAFELDAVSLCLESAGGAAGVPPGLTALPPGRVRQLLPGDAVALQDNLKQASADIYGNKAGQVRSQALIALPISPRTAPGLLAFGSRDPQRFDRHQNTELLQFLGRALATMIRVKLARSPAPVKAGG